MDSLAADRPPIVLLMATRIGLVVRLDPVGKSLRLVAGDEATLLWCSFCRRGKRDVVFGFDARVSRLCLGCAKSCLSVAREDRLRALAAMVFSQSDVAAFETHKKSVEAMVAALPKSNRAVTDIQAPSTSTSACGFCGIASSLTSMLFAGLADYICGACLGDSVSCFVQLREGTDA